MALKERKIEVDRKIQEVRSAIGAAALDGGKINTAELQSLEQERVAIELAEAEQTRRDHAAVAQTQQQQITALLTEIQDATVASLSAKRDAESNLRKAVTAEKLHLLHEATKRKAQAKLNAITGQKQPIESEMQLHREQSMLWASQVKTITNHLGWFGMWELPHGTLPDPNKSWT